MTNAERESHGTPIDEVLAANDHFQDDPMCGAVSFSGGVGYHTFYRHADGIDFAMETALHQALDETLMEIALDPDIIEEIHGDVTPETAARELRDQLTEFAGLSEHSWFTQTLVDEFREKLEEHEEKHR